MEMNRHPASRTQCLHPRLPRSLGFTLIELIVVIAVAAVLLAIAVPNLRNQILASQARQTARGVQDALDFARQYALNTSTLTTFTPSGCGYSVSAMGSNSTTLTSSSGLSGAVGVSCTNTFKGSVSFLGDGSSVTCSSSSSSGSGTSASTTCTSVPANPTPPLTFSASGGGVTWTVTLVQGGLTTMSSTP